MSLTETADEATPVSDVKPAESSPAEGVEKSFLDAVTEALQPKESEATPASEGGKETSEPEAGKTADTSGEPDPTELSDEEMKRLAPKTQARLKKLVALRDEARSEVDAVKVEVERLKPKADYWDQVVGYLDTNNISPRELDNTLEITRLIKTGDYQGALAVLDPIYQELSKRAGKVLPPDLEQRVRLGYIAEPEARELHETRMREQAREQRDERQRAQAQQRQAEQERANLVNRTASYGDQWVSAKKTSDPDWSQKEDLVAEQIDLQLRRRLAADPNAYPKTREEAVALMEDALKVVETRMKKFAPKPQPIRTVHGHFASTRSVAQPRSYMEAIDQALSVGR